MTFQAKNRILAYLVILALGIIGFGAMIPQEPQFTTTYTIKFHPVRIVAEVTPTINQTEFDCMRMNIFQEARGESEKGMEAIALVVLNRTATKHFPNTICGVVHQAITHNGVVVRNKCQFSWFCDNKADTPNLKHPGDRKAWVMSATIARNAMEGKLSNFVGRATHYHATYCSPYWAKAKRFTELTQVGSHIFYQDTKLGLKV